MSNRFEIWSFETSPLHSPGTGILQVSGDFSTCKQWCFDHIHLNEKINYLVCCDEQGALHELITRDDEGYWLPADWIPFVRLRAALWAHPDRFHVEGRRHALQAA